MIDQPALSILPDNLPRPTLLHTTPLPGHPYFMANLYQTIFYLYPGHYLYQLAEQFT
jgi:hypothetical protein